MREIHFYSSTECVESVIEDGDNFCYTYQETEEAIQRDYYTVIHTTSMANLSMDLFNYGIDTIWIHDADGDPFYIKCVKRIDEFHFEIECNATEKELRHGHNLLKMWISGVFSERRNVAS